MKSNDAVPIQVKASREGFILVPHPTVPFESILDYMRKRLEESRDFFHHSEMILDLRARSLRTDEIVALNELLARHSNVRLVEVKLTDTMAFTLERSAQHQGPAHDARTSPPKDSEPVIIRNTCRSGVTGRIVLGLRRPRRRQSWRGNHSRRRHHRFRKPQGDRSCRGHRGPWSKDLGPQHPAQPAPHRRPGRRTAPRTEIGFPKIRDCRGTGRVDRSEHALGA